MKELSDICWDTTKEMASSYKQPGTKSEEEEEEEEDCAMIV